MKIKRLSSLIFLVLLSSCQTASLSVHTEYLSHENLASYYVNTPDPRMNNPAIGQRLIVSWSIPKTFLDLDHLHITLHIRFRNSQEFVQAYPIIKRRGTYLYTLMNDDFIAKKGILTYKVNLLSGDTLLEEWRHQIWVEKIEINHEEATDSTLEIDDEQEF